MRLWWKFVHLIDLLPRGGAVLKGCVLCLERLRNGGLVPCCCFRPVHGDGNGDGLAVGSVKMADRADGILPGLQLWTLLVLRVVAVAVVWKRYVTFHDPIVFAS